MSGLADPVGLARALIGRASVTPEDDGAQALLGGWLERLGFAVTHLRFGRTPNLFASIGAGHPHFCFAGHTDVVPPGDAAWSVPPFAAELREGMLIGRGAADMKGGIAAFVAAVARHLHGGGGDAQRAGIEQVERGFHHGAIGPGGGGIELRAALPQRGDGLFQCGDFIVMHRSNPGKARPGAGGGPCVRAAAAVNRRGP